MKVIYRIGAAAALTCAALLFALPASGQAVKKIDGEEFKRVMTPAGRPLLVNFWATWCEPCREEFPALVKLDAEYEGRVDVITVSLDFEEELTTGVPKFLKEMKATMPTYLLVTADETAAIAAVSKDWSGGLPFTILIAADGSTAYSRQGLIKFEKVRDEIEKVLAAQAK